VQQTFEQNLSDSLGLSDANGNPADMSTIQSALSAQLEQDVSGLGIDTSTWATATYRQRQDMVQSAIQAYQANGGTNDGTNGVVNDGTNGDVWTIPGEANYGTNGGVNDGTNGGVWTIPGTTNTSGTTSVGGLTGLGDTTALQNAVAQLTALGDISLQGVLPAQGESGADYTGIDDATWASMTPAQQNTAEQQTLQQNLSDALGLTDQQGNGDTTPASMQAIQAAINTHIQQATAAQSSTPGSTATNTTTATNSTTPTDYSQFTNPMQGLNFSS
jgi:hypothetical protein